MQQIKINNNQESAVIDIEGTIGVPEQWQFEDPQQRVATYERFRTALTAIEELQAKEVVVNIRSTGGDVGDALLIYDALASLDAQITTRCWGYVASAATVIAQAASEGLREISPNALYLIHSSTCAAEGNAQELAQRAELLRKSDERLAELYAGRSGRDLEEFVTLMAEEGGDGRWMSANETIEAGLADKLIESVPVMTRVSESIESALSSVKGMIRKIGVQLKQEITQQPQDVVDCGVDNVVDNVAAEAPQQSLVSQIAFEQTQTTLQPTSVGRCEDPSLIEASQITANQSAYQNDAKRLRGAF